MTALTGMTSKVKGLVGTVSDAVNTAAKSVSDRLDQSETGRAIKDVSTKAAGLASEAGAGVSIAAEKAINNINGTEALRQIEELVAQQRRYNDVLATRLAEALTRIDHLEQQVKQLTNER